MKHGFLFFLFFNFVFLVEGKKKRNYLYLAKNDCDIYFKLQKRKENLEREIIMLND